MVLIAFIALIGDTIIAASASLGRAVLHARELQVVRTGLASTIEATQSAIAHNVAPQPRATCAYDDANGCALTLKTASVAATPAPQATGACGACSATMQGNASVAESRASYSMSATLVARNGETIVTRRGTVAFRTFNAAPFATLVGSLDGTLDALMNGGTGDDGGSASATNGTLIHVQYQNTNTGSGLAADSWRVQDEQPATNLPDWSR
jgi:hypothetical protein